MNDNYSLALVTVKRIITISSLLHLHREIFFFSFLDEIFLNRLYFKLHVLCIIAIADRNTFDALL